MGDSFRDLVIFISYKKNGVYFFPPTFPFFYFFRPSFTWLFSFNSYIKFKFLMYRVSALMGMSLQNTILTS